MNTETPRTDEWETYCDESYYHLWRVRRKNERGFNDGYHLQNRDEAKALVDLLNKQDSELNAARAEIDKWEQIACDKLSEVCRQIENTRLATEQRDKALSDLAFSRDLYRLQTKTLDEQRDYLWDRAMKILETVTEQRDRLADIVKKIRAGYGGQLVDTDCDCSDCEFLRPIDEALQSLTTNEL